MESRYFLLGAIPFGVVGLAAVVIAIGLAIFIFVSNLSADDITEIVIAMVTIWLIVVSIMFFIGRFCGGIRPYERFVDSLPLSLSLSLPLTLEEAEKRTCALIAEVDKFIESDVGIAGIDSPWLVKEAKQKARDAVNMPMPECLSETKTEEKQLTNNPACPCPCPIKETEAEKPIDDEERLKRIQAALTMFTGPQLKATYDISMRCEGFTSEKDNKLTLDAIKAILEEQETKLLAPILQKQVDLKAGKLSDCDRQRGADAAVGDLSKFDL